MRIESSNINMSAQTSVFETSAKEESLRYWNNNQDPAAKPPTTTVYLPLVNRPDGYDISEEWKSMSDEDKSAYFKGLAMQKTGSTSEVRNILSETEKAKLLMLQQFIEALTGKKFSFLLPEDLSINTDKLQEIKDKLRKMDETTENTQAKGIELHAVEVQVPQKQGWGLAYDSNEVHYESQALDFQASGNIKTSDGREINFSVELSMSREFMSGESIRVRAGDALIDPLVINFDAPAAQLTQDKFSFDIDSDGDSDQISFVAPGSGFLSLDLNNDGIINNGGELFGTKSGDGFSDLAAYDSDKNNWIDENDAIFDKLRIWTKDESGNDQLLALGQKGIGAVYLGNVDTSYSLKDAQNNTNGEIQKTGLFVREDGMIGTVQHVDLAI